MRLVKGAYKEPKTVAYQKKSEVDEAFVRLMQVLLDDSTYPAIATHDPAMIDATKQYAAEKGYAKDRFEFQMLYGIRRDLQASLVEEGYPHARLRAVRPAVVSVLHAPARRAAGERRLRAPRASSAKSEARVRPLR